MQLIFESVNIFYPISQSYKKNQYFAKKSEEDEGRGE